MTGLRGEAYWQGATGNNGPHQLVECRWVLGQSGLPPRVISLGGRFGVDFKKTPAVLGPWLEMDSAKEDFLAPSILSV